LHQTAAGEQTGGNRQCSACRTPVQTPRRHKRGGKIARDSRTTVKAISRQPVRRNQRVAASPAFNDMDILDSRPGHFICVVDNDELHATVVALASFRQCSKDSIHAGDVNRVRDPFSITPFSPWYARGQCFREECLARLVDDKILRNRVVADGQEMLMQREQRGNMVEASCWTASKS
jgi:hypothetical protein